uniref:PSI domain-containing protein n=1 Tax=Grammatophora oceanica TaxID=210454 RepID=A0A7S1YJ98_9STRA|mmetsp:Transcript_56/g.67  ORF Transcript_56/g.67 Transcript_56/m.67 type:complete len:183 (+) Transcript_56:71-619(+)
MKSIRLTTLLLLSQLGSASCATEEQLSRPISPPTFPVRSRDLASDDGGCSIVSQCTMCTATQRRSEEECKSTGRIEIVDCKGEEDEDVHRFRSCKRTQADEQFLMVRMEVICFFLGSLAFLSAKRQKSIHTTLFDQRRQAKRSSTMGSDAHIEMSVLNGDGDEERAPLVQSSPLTTERIDVV